MSKNSNFKRITAFMLALIMIVGALPASVFASEGETTTPASYTLDVSSLEKPSSRAYVAGIDVSGPKVKTVNNVNAKEYTANTTDGTNFDIVLAYGTAQDATITINFTKGGTSSQQKKLTFASDYLSGDTTATIQLAEGKAEAVVKSSYTFGKTEEADWKFTFSIQETEDVFVPVESVSLDKQEIKLIPSQEVTLTATVSPKTATNDTVTWTSSDQTVATVENGKVKAKAYGTTTITATAEEKSATCTVTVGPNIAVATADGTAIELTPYESGSAAGNGYLGIVPVGKDITVKGNDVLSPVITGYFGGGEIWKSVTKVDDNTITITADQIWSMLGTKEAFISDTSEGTIGKYPSEWLTDNSHVFAVNIYYDVNGSDWGYAVLLLEYPYKYAESIAFEKEAYEVEAEKTLQLNPIIEPADTTDRVSWVSTDERYATVDQNGLVTAIKPGNTTIEATINGFTASCEVKVVEAVPDTTIDVSEGKLSDLGWLDSITIGGVKVVDSKVVTELHFREGNDAQNAVYVNVTLDKDTPKDAEYSIKLTPGGTEGVILTPEGNFPSIPGDWMTEIVTTEPTEAYKYNLKDGRATFAAPVQAFVDDWCMTTLYVNFIVEGTKLPFEITAEGEDVDVEVRADSWYWINPMNYATYYSLIPNGKDITFKLYDRQGNVVNGFRIEDWEATTNNDGSITVSKEVIASKVGFLEVTWANIYDASGNNIASINLIRQRVAATEITLDKETAEITTGGTLQLTATVAPENTTDTVNWISTDERYVTVDQNGLVTAVKPGSATIEATINGFTASCEVTVVEAVPELIVTANGTPLEVQKNANGEFFVKAQRGAEIVIEAGKGAVSQVLFPAGTVENGKGIVSGEALKTRTVDQLAPPPMVEQAKKDYGFEMTDFANELAIVDFSVEGEKLAKVLLVELIPNLQAIALDKTTLELSVGSTYQLTAAFTPADAADNHVVWDSESSLYASVDENGLVTANKPGTTVITAKVDDIVASCEVTVTDKITVPEGYYEVLLKADEGVTLEFFNGEEKITEGIYDKGVSDGVQQYIAVLPEGTYDFRGTQDGQKLGGMQFKVPVEDEYASDGTLMGKGNVVTLKRLNFYPNNTEFGTAGQYAVTIVPKDYDQAVAGEQYVDAGGYLITPVLINAAGNVTTYQIAIDILDTELVKKYGIDMLVNQTYGGTNAENIMLPVKKISYYSVTAPETAKVQAFKQINNFNVKEVACAYTEKAEDGMIRYFYPSSSNMTYRVSQEGKITRAGFFGIGSSYTQGIVANEIVVTFNEKENPKTTNSTARRIENSSVLNVNAKNNLDLEVGGTFRLRAYRAAWEIINTDTANIMIEPDFHYEILAGEDVIDVKTVTDVCTGNATGNWMDITGLKEGIAIIEVSYDAIIIGGNTQYTGQFGATEESRKSLVVVEVGGTGEDTLEVTSTHGTHEKYVWDVDLSTVYMFGDKTDFTFTAEINESQPDKVEYTTDDGKTWKTATKDGENYTVKDLLAGNNIIKVTKGDNVEYQVVRVTKASVTIKNLTRPGDKTIIVGDTITVHFNNVYDPTPKMSGIYNPGFSGATTTKYTVNNPDGVTYSATSKQYGFATDNLITLKFTEAGTFTFADGYIDSHVMGNPSGEHRSLTDTGCGTNFNARNGDSNRCVLPDLEFTVVEDPTVLLEIRSNPAGAKVEIEGYEPNEDGYFELNYGTYRYKLTLEGYVPVKGSVDIAGDDYLLDGTKVVLVDMTKIDEDTIWDGKSTVRPKKDENGVWLISNGYEFAGYAKFGEGQDAKLTADISLGGFGMTAPLSGTFDGNGHWIRDFYHNDSLFSLSADGAVVKNLGVEGEVDTTQGSAGAIVRSNTKTVTLENVVSYVDFNYTGDTFLTTSGGLVGEASGCTIINCYNTGRMYTRFGGAGSISMSGASVQNSYSIGFNSSSDSYGVIKSGGTVKNNYALENTAKKSGGSFMSEADMKKADFAETLGSAYLYNPTSYNDGYPILTWEEPSALSAALTEFIPVIENYKDFDAYLDEQKAELSAAIKAGKEALAAATTLEEAIKALNDAKAAMDKIRTADDIGDESEDDQTADVYFSLSHDDKFVFAEASGTVMALQNIKVPYFDLALYGLEKYYFVSESYDQGGQVGGNIGNASSAIYNGKVTMLHLFIYATEVYYLGIDPEDAGKGYLYEAGLVGTEIFEPTQSAGSMYMKHLWGMDENFNYYYNYAYPLASEGWGSTADQILLHDGDVVTIGHFTSWNFHLDDMSVFNYIKDGDKIINTSAKQGEAVELTVLLAAKGGNYTTAHLPMANRGVYISPIDEMTNNTTQWQFIGTSDENGKIVVLTDDLEPGKYIIGTPGQKGIQYKTEICSTPGAIYLTVEDTVHTHTFGNWNIVKDAKCNEYGEKVRYCSYCPAYETENIDVLAHTPKVVGAIEATCAKPGYTGDTVCDVCDSRLATGKVVDKLAHTEVAIEGKDATCTEAGLTEGKKCTVCGTVTVAQEEIAALGHKEEVLQGKAATCTETGLTEGKKCTVCGTVTVAQEVIAALGHKEEIIPGKPATETETGLTEGKKCSVCGEIIVKQEEIPVLEKEYTLGDVNGDGKVNALDATQILRYANNKASVLSGVEKDTALYKAADVNADGKINALDATQILRYANNKASVFDK